MRKYKLWKVKGRRYVKCLFTSTSRKAVEKKAREFKEEALAIETYEKCRRHPMDICDSYKTINTLYL